MLDRKIAFLCTIGALACSPAASAAPVILKGPYAQNLGTNEVTIMYQTSETAQMTLWFGYTPAADSDKRVSNGTMHEVTLYGLEPGRKLYYRLEGAAARSNIYAEGGVNSTSGSVLLQPFSRKFRFVVLGDTRSGHDAHSDLAKLITAEQPVLVINSGDLVSDGMVESDWQTYFDIEHDLMASTVLLPALGNHDCESGNADPYFKYFSVPTVRSNTEAYYFSRFGNVLVMVLDSEINFSFLGFSLDQGAFIKYILENDGAAAGIEHRFVAIHAGPYASKPDRTGNAAMRGLMDQFKTWKVNAVFSGHDHNYERGLSNNGLPYVITGGGGAGLYDVGDIGSKILPPHEVIYNKKDYNYVLVTIHGPWAKFEAKDRNGTIIDTWSYGVEPVDECLQDGDCDGINKPHDPCSGSWACESYTCVWHCAPVADGGTADAARKDAGVKDSGLVVTDSGTDAALPSDSGLTADAAADDDSGVDEDSEAWGPDARSKDGVGGAAAGGCGCSALGI
jgi:hypothetical protein